jgi:prepilin-type N-terminal cleavage/methylation domain-containing protein/prepilin-type processing-associated H-X9-DG protein
MVRRAFTLMELLVVVGVIALLVAIMVPALGVAKAQAKRALCAANLRSLAAADVLYANLYNGFVSRNSGRGLAPSVFYLLADSQQIDLTPVKVPGGSTGFEAEYAAAFSRIKWLQCPCFPAPTRPVCFVVSAFDQNDVGKEVSWVRLNEIRNPSGCCNFTEANVNLPAEDYEIYDVWHTNHLVLNYTTPVKDGANGGGRIMADNRHRGQMNISYYDGHVDSKAYKKVNGQTNITVDDFVSKQ